MQRKKSYLIIGYGWLGEFIASSLLAGGNEVTGITRNQQKTVDLEEKGGKALHLTVSSESKFVDLPQFDVAICALPPGTRKGSGEEYPPLINNLFQQLKINVKKWVLISSTSVYPQIDGEFAESDVSPSEHHQNVLLQAEGIALNYAPDSIILRLAGLYGAGRHPVNYLSGRTGITGADSPVNLISGEHVAQVLAFLVKENQQGIFNVCASEHPTKKKYYSSVALEKSLPVPHFESGGPKRIISNKKLIKLIETRHFRMKLDL